MMDEESHEARYRARLEQVAIKKAARRKHWLKALNRNQLNRLVSDDRRPWNWDRESLAAHILEHWSDETTDDIVKMVESDLRR